MSELKDYHCEYKVTAIRRGAKQQLEQEQPTLDTLSKMHGAEYKIELIRMKED